MSCEGIGAPALRKWITIGFLLVTSPLLGGVSWLDIAKTPSDNWLSYSGDYSGRRFSSLNQIQSENASHLVAQWTFHVAGATRLEVTPVVVDGVMYVTNSNEVYALDARTGRTIWHYKQPHVKNEGPNRGVAVLEDRIFFVTSDAHLIALHRMTGGVLWDVQYADATKNYSASLAPLAVKGKMIVGVSGAECGIRGYIDAYEAASGKHAWRFWTIPTPGEPGAETWGGQAAEFSGGPTWMTGTYDPAEDILYWTTGNPGPDFYGGARPGDNLYTDCVIALDPNTGKRKWHFQFTPHDTHDWDAQEFPVVIDTAFQGRPRKLLVQANRNGFFYVLDREDGRMLLAKPFVKKLNWARGILSSGRPDVVAALDPTPEGNLVCPGVIGGTNWFSPSYNPQTGLFYVMTVEMCDIYRSSARSFKKGECNDGTGFEHRPSDPGQFILRAIDIQTGSIRWEIPITGNDDFSMPGTLTTAGGLVFFGDIAGYLAAADAGTGAVLWNFYTGQSISASPMTYAVGGRQYVSIASGADIFAFALFEPLKPANPPQVEERSSQSVTQEKCNGRRTSGREE
jgi:alcohol dehydrogenase (cytochrome c)